MQRNSTVFLCLLLCLCLAPFGGPAAAGAGEASEYFGGLLADTETLMQSAAVVDGKAYALAEGSLYVLEGGEGRMRLLARLPDAYAAAQLGQTTVNALFAHEGRLMGLNRHNGLVYDLLPDGEGMQLKERLRLDWSPFVYSQEGGRQQVNEPGYVVCAYGKLFVKQNNPGGELAEDLYSYELNTGAMQGYRQTGLLGLVPWLDGKLLGLRLDRNEPDPATGDMEDAKPVAFDPATDSVEKLKLRLPPGGADGNRSLTLHFDVRDQQLYAANGGGIYCLREDAGPLMVARLPMAGAWMEALATPALLPWAGEELLAAFPYQLFRRSRDVTKLKPATSLRVSLEDLDARVVARALMENDDIELLPYEGPPLSPQRLSQLLLTGELDLDLLWFLSMQTDAQRLMQKGCLLPLDSEPGLRTFGEGCFPAFRKLMYGQGQLYALPIRLEAYYDAANAAGFQAIGRPIPGSLDELLDLVAWWAEEGAEKHPDYRLFSDIGGSRLLKGICFNLYLNSQLGEGQALSFTQEGFGRLMERIDAIPFERLESESEEQVSDEGQPQALISLSLNYAAEEPLPEGEARLELPLRTGEKAWRRAYASMLCIPATTKHPEAARRFLASYVKHLRPLEQAALSAAWTEPIPNPGFDKEKQELTGQLQMHQELLEKATGEAEKREQQEGIERMRNFLAHLEKERRFLLSAEQITSHRAFMEQVYFDEGLGLTQREALFKGGRLFQPYLEGQLTLAQFMQQANDRIRLMTLEMQ